MSEQRYISELHNDHTMWLSELSLASDELKSFRNRLEEIAKANSGSEIMAQVEHFQNQFIRENEVIDILQHDIREFEREVSANAAANNVAVEHRKISENPGLRDRMSTFHKIFGELKSEFTAFVSKTL